MIRRSVMRPPDFSGRRTHLKLGLGSIQWTVNNGIVSGRGDSGFASLMHAARARAAKTVSILLQDL